MTKREYNKDYQQKHAEKLQEYRKRYYAKNRERKLAWGREYQQTHKKRIGVYQAEYRLRHKKDACEWGYRYRAAHKKEIKLASIAYYQKNRDRILKYKQVYHKEHPECSVATRENRRARSKTAGKMTLRMVQGAYERNIATHGRLTCYLCCQPIEFGQDSLEHKTPLVRGGTHEPNNLDIAHLSCNSSKNTKTDREYTEYLVLKSGVFDD